MNNFSQTLYEQICIAFPSTTARTFSKDCDMSEGYWGSIQAQKLPISTKALNSLANTMDMKANIVAHTDGNNHKRKQLVQNIKQMIADEIAVRQTTANISSNHNLRRMILESVSKIAERRSETYVNSAPPISVGFGR